MPQDILGRPIVTASQLQAMTPAERKALFDSRVITDLEQLPAEYLARLRAGAEELIGRRDAERALGLGMPHAS